MRGTDYWPNSLYPFSVDVYASGAIPVRRTPCRTEAEARSLADRTATYCRDAGWGHTVLVETFHARPVDWPRGAWRAPATK